MKETRRKGLLHGLFLGGTAFFVLLSSMYVFPSFWEKYNLNLSDRSFKLGLDLQGGAHLVYDADMTNITDTDRDEALEGVRDVIERRVNTFGVSEPLVQTNKAGDNYRVIVELAGVFDINEAIQAIGQTPILQFKLPAQDINTEVTPEQEEQIEAAQKTEREAALEVLGRAKQGEDFGALAKEFSVDEATSGAGGYVGFVTAEDPTFDGLVEEIRSKRYKPGVITGLYESTSAMHIVDFKGTRAVEEAELSHILICYSGAQRCEQSRTKEEAQALINELAGKITAVNFADLAQENSDDPSNAPQGGELGWVPPGIMVAPFEEAYLNLQDDQISGVVETDFGYHLIHRTGTRAVTEYEIAHIEMPWTTASDVVKVDPWENTELSGKDVRRASVAFNPNTNEPYITLEFNKEGGDMFSKLTEENVGQIMGIFLDGYPISTPQIQQAIYGGTASIVGDFTVLEAKDLARSLNAGALPVPVKLVSQKTVGPTLGAISLERSIDAALVGFLLVGLFMLLYYRFAGVISVLALLTYAMLNLVVYKALGITMTLSGIAGFILSLGMAVDANVLIFERLKEELNAGRDFRTAVDEGFRRAWTSIRDGNVTTLVAAFVLFALSSSFIKGFAVTLSLGVLLSMFSAIVVTRVLLYITSEIPALRAPRLYGVKK